MFKFLVCVTCLVFSGVAYAQGPQSPKPPPSPAQLLQQSQQSLKQLQQQLLQVRQQRDQSDNEAAQAEQQVLEYNDKVITLQGQIQALNDKLTKADMDKTALQKQVTSLTAEIAKIKTPPADHPAPKHEGKAK